MPGRWHLWMPKTQGGEYWNVWYFQSGKPVEPVKGLIIPTQSWGTPMDFTMSGIKGIPIITSKLGELFTRLFGNSIQRFPVAVTDDLEGRLDDAYEILNICESVDCIDMYKSGILWKRIDREDESKYIPRIVDPVIIEPSSVGDKRIFRVKKWMTAIVLTEEDKNILEGSGFSGMKFIPV